MKTFSVAHVKTNLSSILKEVESGEEIAISFGKKKRDDSCNSVIQCIQTIQQTKAGNTSKQNDCGIQKRF